MNGPILQKPWQGASPPLPGGVAEPGDGQGEQERGERDCGERQCGGVSGVCHALWEHEQEH